jgi:hypothetical protein
VARDAQEAEAPLKSSREDFLYNKRAKMRLAKHL